MKIEVWLKGTGGLTAAEINRALARESDANKALATRVIGRLFRDFDATADAGLYELGFTYEMPSSWLSVSTLLEWVFTEGNIGETSEFATGYRAAGNRSISVGDVVVIDDVSYACASTGWTPIEYLPVEAQR